MDVYFSLAVETSTITEPDNDSASESAPSFAIELADILLRTVKQGNGLILSRLVYFLVATSFRIQIIKRYMKSLADSEIFTT